jgi:hypothetical protein
MVTDPQICDHAAQTGYDGYCKLFFKTKSPKKYAEKNARRHTQCTIRSEERELVHKLFCKPCFKARSCSGCGAMSQEESAAHCSNCKSTREGKGAKQRRLVIWCSACFNEELILSGLCEMCFNRRQKADRALGKECQHCGIPEEVLDQTCASHVRSRSVPRTSVSAGSASL